MVRQGWHGADLRTLLLGNWRHLKSAYAAREWVRISQKYCSKCPRKQSPGRGWRCYLRCAVCTETKQDSVIERLNFALEQMSLGMAGLVVWCQLHNINFRDRNVRQPKCEGSVSCVSVVWKKWFSGAGNERQRGTKAGSTVRIQLFFMKNQEVKFCSWRSKNSSCQTMYTPIWQRKSTYGYIQWQKLLGFHVTGSPQFGTESHSTLGGLMIPPMLSIRPGGSDLHGYTW